MSKMRVNAAALSDRIEAYRYLDERAKYRADRDVGSGSWVLIKCHIPVEEAKRPMTYGIYWATPIEDSFGRQKVCVYTPSEVCLLNHEYSIITEERLEEYKELGYFLKETGAVQCSGPMNIALIEKGRSLCEEEREVIWALQLDGLSEMQACEEYFLSHHIDGSYNGICYLPTKEILAEIVSVFGERGIPG